MIHGAQNGGLRPGSAHGRSEAANAFFVVQSRNAVGRGRCLFARRSLGHRVRLEEVAQNTAVTVVPHVRILAGGQQAQSHGHGDLAHQAHAGIAFLLGHADGVTSEQLAQQAARFRQTLLDQSFADGRDDVICHNFT